MHRSFLTNHRTRLETMSEAESTLLAVREVYSAYYSEMGGVGAAPEPQFANQRRSATSCGSRGRLKLSPLHQLRAIRPGQ